MITYLFCFHTHVPSVPQLDKSWTYAIPLVRPLPIPLPHDWMNMGVCFVNFNKGEDDEGCLKFCNILKWRATVKEKSLKSCLEITICYGSKHKCESPITVLKYNTPWPHQF